MGGYFNLLLFNARDLRVPHRSPFQRDCIRELIEFEGKPQSEPTLSPHVPFCPLINIEGLAMHF